MRHVAAFALALVGVVVLGWASDRLRRRPASSSALVAAETPEPGRRGTTLPPITVRTGPSSGADDSEQLPGFHGIVLDRSTGAPIAGASVFVCGTLDSSGYDCEEEVGSTVTEEDGTFFIDASDAEENGADSDSRESEPSPEPRFLVVRAVGFAEIALGREAVARSLLDEGVRLEIAAMASVHGRVVGADGEAVEGARVSRAGCPGCEVSTAATGEYELHVPPGRSTIAVLAEDRSWDDGRDELATASTDVDLRPRESRVVDLVLAPQALYAVTGRLVDRWGRPLAGVAVTVDPDFSRIGGVDRMLIGAGAETGLDGDFEVELASAGPHRLLFWASPGARREPIAVAVLAARRAATNDEDEAALPDVVSGARDVLACSLRDAENRPSAIRSVGVTGSSSGSLRDGGAWSGGFGFGSSGSEVTEVHLVWPPGATELTISLGGGAGGTVTLHSPNDPCLAVEGAPSIVVNDEPFVGEIDLSQLGGD